MSLASDQGRVLPIALEIKIVSAFIDIDSTLRDTVSAPVWLFSRTVGTDWWRDRGARGLLGN